MYFVYGILSIISCIVIVISKTLAIFPAQIGQNPEKYPWHFDKRFYEDLPTQQTITTPIIGQYREKCHRQGKPCTIFPHQELIADMMRLRHIQYLAKTIGSETTPYFFEVMKGISALSPYRSDPYRLGLLLGSVNKSSTLVDTDAKYRSRTDTVTYGTSGTTFLCDPKTIAMIKKLSLTEFAEKLGTDDMLANPCQDPIIPYYLGFNTFYYLDNPQAASDRYKVASLNDDAIPFASTMAATVLAQTDDQQKNITIRVSRLGDPSIIQDKASDQTTRIIQQISHHTILFLIQQTEQTFSPQCFHDLTCMMQSGLLDQTIQKVAVQCQNTQPQTPDQSALCLGLKLTLQGKYIHNDTIISPFAEQVGERYYGRDEQREQRNAQKTQE